MTGRQIALPAHSLRSLRLCGEPGRARHLRLRSAGEHALLFHPPHPSL